MAIDEIKQKLLDLKLELEFIQRKNIMPNIKSQEAYIDLLNSKINKTYLELLDTLQSECKHNVWYLLRQSKSFNTSINTCRCIECGMIRTGESEKFKGKMITKNRSDFFCNKEQTYSKIRNEYDKLTSELSKEESAKKILAKYMH